MNKWDNQQLQARWNTGSTVLGLLAWLGAVLLSMSDAPFLDQIGLLIFFGIAVIAPLTLAVVERPPRNRLHSRVYTLAVFLQPVTALLSGASLLSPIGVSAGVLASSWLALTGLMALYGLGHFVWKPRLADLCIIVGLVYAPVSGVWFVIHQTWGAFLNFDAPIVLLTAAHFCFIGLAALILGGLSGRYLANHLLYRVSAVGMIVSPMLVAMGITLTAFGAGVSPVEVVGVVMLAGSVLLLSLLILTRVRAQIEPRWARRLITLSASSLLLTMVLALAYSIGRYTELLVIPLPDMVQWHGWFNAVGFAFLGLLGWRVTNGRAGSQ